MGSGYDEQGRSFSFRPHLQCPACDATLCHDVKWARLYNAVYFIFFSFVFLVILLPVAAYSVLLYVFLSIGVIYGLWGLGKMIVVPLREQENPFLEKILFYFREFGFHEYTLKSTVTDPENPDNGEIIIHMGHMRLRFMRLGGQEFVEFGDSDALFGTYYTFDDVFVAHGWQKKEEIAGRDRAIGLYDACRGIRKYQKQLEIIFDPENIDVALTKVRLIRDQRQAQKGWIDL